jgi:release factor glutamine methyltransferase
VTVPVAARVDEAARRLESAGWAPADARLDAAVLARAALGWTTATWLTRNQDAPPAEFAPRFDDAIARRLRHEPVAYILGQREFYGRAFHLTRDVLIPRPETELVVDAALSRLGPRASDRTPAAVIDIGTGSGCLAVTLAAERPNLRIVATDISAAALDLARGNAVRHGVADRVTFVHGALFAAQAGPWDVVVANPPYVARRDRDALPADVRDFEPDLALFGGDDGLSVIGDLVRAAAGSLADAGTLLMEIGARQADAVTALLAAADLRVSDIVRDLQQHPRVVIAQRTGRTPARASSSDSELRDERG